MKVAINTTTNSNSFYIHNLNVNNLVIIKNADILMSHYAVIAMDYHAVYAFLMG